MIRFIDLRYQGTQARFAFFDTVVDRFETWSTGAQSWSTWDEFIEDLLRKAPLSYGARRKALCPSWVFDPPTDEELGFAEQINLEVARGEEVFGRQGE